MECKKPSPEDIARKLNGAVVQVTGEILLTTTAAPTIPTDYTSEFLVGNGVFVKDHYIVCPASLVLIPPEILALRNRYPYVSSTQPVPPGTTPNTITAVSRILVAVNNVNNKKQSFTYKAKLVGVDGAGDLAYLQIDHKDPYNASSPPICKEHPRLRWGESADLCAGQKIYSFGDFTADTTSAVVPVDLQTLPADPGFLQGVVSNNTTLDFAGSAQQQLLLVDFPVRSPKTGMPFINEFGQLVGIQTLSFNQGMVAGPTEAFLRRPLKVFLCAKPNDPRLTVISDVNGSYYAFNKAYAGIAWRAVNTRTYGTRIDPITGRENVLLDGSGVPATTPSKKELIGVQVIGVAGFTGSTGSNWVNLPGAAGAPAIFPYPPLDPTVNSPLLGTIFPGDIITHINGKAVGGFYKQVPPAYVTWALTPGAVLEIVYRKVADSYASINKTIVASAAYPRAYDYPYAKAKNFPALIAPFPTAKFQQPF